MLDIVKFISVAHLIPDKMHIRQTSLPTYAQSCESAKHSKLCQFACMRRLLKDPILAVIILAVLIGSSCLLSGLILLCMISRTLNDQTSEAILLLGMGFFVSSVACVTWKLTMRSRLEDIMEAIKEEHV